MVGRHLKMLTYETLLKSEIFTGIKNRKIADMVVFELKRDRAHPWFKEKER
jgi:hypothetical protein